MILKSSTARGVSNGNADALSRRHYDSVVASMDKPGVQIERVRELQRSDPTLADIITYLESSRLPNTSAEARAIVHSIDDYYLDPDGLLCHLWVPRGRRVPGIKSQLVIPTSLRHEILVGGHDDPLAGHLGVNKTYEKLRERYYWPDVCRRTVLVYFLYALPNEEEPQTATNSTYPTNSC